MNTMSMPLVIQVLFLIVFAAVAFAVLHYYTLVHFTKWASKYQEAQIGKWLDDDELEPNDKDADVLPMYPR